MKIHPSRGIVYLGRADGFWRSLDGGANFVRTLTGAVGGLDAVASAPNRVFINRADGVWVSSDSGATFSRRGNSGLPNSSALKFLKMSPVDPNAMLLLQDGGTNGALFNLNWWEAELATSSTTGGPR